MAWETFSNTLPMARLGGEPPFRKPTSACLYQSMYDTVLELLLVCPVHLTVNIFPFNLSGSQHSVQVHRLGEHCLNKQMNECLALSQLPPVPPVCPLKPIHQPACLPQFCSNLRLTICPRAYPSPAPEVQTGNRIRDTLGQEFSSL